MDAAFIKLLTLSFQAGIITLAVLLLRPLLKKAPKKLVCCLWALVALRLLLPFSPESRLSLMPEPALPEVLTVTEALAPQSPVPEVPAESKPLPAPEPLPPVPGPVAEPEPDQAPDPMTVLQIVYGTGVMAMVLYGAISYGRLRRRVAPALTIRDNIYFCDYIDSPFVMGTFRPRIYLPSAIGEKDIPYILAHEQAHISRGDPFWKLLGFALLTLHWFNPLLWIAFLLFCRDMESACDEKVIAGLGDAARVPYSNALLSCSLPRGRIYPLAFGEIGVKQRIRQVLNYRKPALWITAAAVLALLITGVCLLTTRPGIPLSELWTFPEDQPIRVLANYKAYALADPEGQAALLKLMKTVRCDREPLADLRDPKAPGTMQLMAHTLDLPSGLFFSPDGTQVTLGSLEVPEAGYAIRNPEVVRDFFSQWLRPFANREVSGKPLWQEDAPWAWTKGVDTDRLEKIKLQTWLKEEPRDLGSGLPGGSATQGGGIYNERNTRQLLELLHGLKEEAFTPASPLEWVSVYDICEPAQYGSPCTAVVFFDGIDSRILVLRQEQNALDLYVSQQVEPDLEKEEALLSFRHWSLQDPALLNYIQSLWDASPTVATFVGWEHDWDIPREMAHEDARIYLPVIRGWEVEEVAPEETAPWGFRVRPAGEAGSLFFGFWPQGFSLGEENRYLSEGSSYQFDYTAVSYPDSVLPQNGGLDIREAVWSYQLFRGDIGDYAILNEGADNWFPRYRDAIEDICMLTQFQGMLPEDMPRTAAGPDITLWQKTVKPSDLEKPTLRTAELPPDGAPIRFLDAVHLKPDQLEPFLSVLRSIKEEDITDRKYQQRQSLEDLLGPVGQPQTASVLQLPIKDRGQILVLVLRTDPENDYSTLGFYMTEQYEQLMADPFAKVVFNEYSLNDSSLTPAMERLVVRAGSRQWAEPLTMEHGKARLTVEPPLGWECEAVPYADDETPWGYRLRPRGEEGWLFVSFCPQGLPGEPGAEQPCSEFYGPRYAPFGGFVVESYTEDDYDDSGRKPEAVWKYRLYRCSFGDYVIFNQEADAWMSKYDQEIRDILILCEFRGDPV